MTLLAEEGKDSQQTGTSRHLKEPDVPPQRNPCSYQETNLLGMWPDEHKKKKNGLNLLNKFSKFLTTTTTQFVISLRRQRNGWLWSPFEQASVCWNACALCKSGTSSVQMSHELTWETYCTKMFKISYHKFYKKNKISICIYIYMFF